MPILRVWQLVIQMVCTSVQKTTTVLESEEHEVVECEELRVSEEIDQYYEDARMMRKILAQEKALRQLEQRKANALAMTHRLSFMR
ncbi:MAG: hypothetical protein ACFFD6_05290 [Candidatus Thorarchaeota archaeon]